MKTTAWHYYRNMKLQMRLVLLGKSGGLFVNAEANPVPDPGFLYLLVGMWSDIRVELAKIGIDHFYSLVEAEARLDRDEVVTFDFNATDQSLTSAGFKKMKPIISPSPRAMK